MLETIRVRKAGYPFRYTFPIFLYKFKCLLSHSVKNASPAEKIKYICDEACPPELSKYLVVGKSKVFMKQDAFFFLEKASEARLRVLALIIQKNLRGFRDRRRYLNVQWAAKYLNRYIKGYVQRIRYQKTKAAILTLQRCTRGFLVRHHNRQEAERMRQQMLREAEEKLKQKGATAEEIKAVTQHLTSGPEPEELNPMEEELQILTSFTQNQMKKVKPRHIRGERHLINF